MFEKIVIRRSEATGAAVTLGEVAEAMMFYQSVHLVLDPGSLRSLGIALGIEELLALIARKRLTAVYTEDMLAANTQTIGAFPRHGFNTIMQSGKAGGPVQKSRRGRLELQLEGLASSRSEARRYADRFMDLVPIKSYGSDYFVAGGIPKSANAEMDDQDYVREALRKVLRTQVGFEQFADNLSTEIIRLEGQFVLQSNIDFELGNAHRTAKSPELGIFTEASLVLALLEANADVNIAAHYGGDFHTHRMSSDIIQIKFSELLKRTGISGTQLQEFKNIVLPEYPSIREVINSKERTFGEFEKLLDQSDKFRRVVNKMSPDTNLVSEYLKQITQEGWAASLPAKIIRFVIGLGIEGAHNPIADKAWSIADTFLIDKLKGWRPNHFVDEQLKPFLEKDR